MAFAQFDLPGKPCATSRPASRSTHRNSDHMGFRQPVRRSTLADAQRKASDWRIHAALAQRLITQARTLYVDEELGLDLTNTVVRPGRSTTSRSVPMSVFPWAHFRTTKAAVKMHTLLDLRGNIPQFYRAHLGWQAARRLMPSICSCRKPEPSTIVDRGYVDFARLYVLHQAGALLRQGAAKSNIDAACAVYSAPTDRSTGDRFATRPSPWTASTTRQDYPELSAAHTASRTPSPCKTLVFITQQLLASGQPPSARSTKAAGRWNSSSTAGSSSIFGSGQFGTARPEPRGEDADLDCRLGLRPRRRIVQEAPRPGRPRSTTLPTDHSR